MDVTMIGLQNAGKSSLLRVLAVCSSSFSRFPHSTPPLLCLCMARYGLLIALRRAGNLRLSKSFLAEHRNTAGC